MMKLKIGEKELKIKFAYKPTLKERVISKLVKVGNLSGDSGVDMEKVEDMLLYLPEILLVGVQACHEEYRYNYDTKEGKEEQLDKMFDLIEEYCEQEDADIMGLFEDFQKEMESDGFLRSLFQREKATKKKKEQEKAEKS